MVASHKRKEEEEESKEPRSRERVAWVSHPSFVVYTVHSYFWLQSLHHICIVIDKDVVIVIGDSQ